MKKLYDIRDKLCKELDQIGEKRELNAGDLETVHKLTDTIKNIDKIGMLEMEGYSQDDGYSQRGGSYGGHSMGGGYSQRGNWEAEMRGEYGNSYARRGQHYVRGHYSRDGGQSMDSYSRDGGYSRGDSREHLERMMREARTEREREAIQRCMDEMR